MVLLLHTRCFCTPPSNCRQKSLLFGTAFWRCWRSGLSLFADAVAWRRVSPPSWSLDGCLFKVISEVFFFKYAKKNPGVYKGLIVISHVFPSLIRGGYVGGMIGEPGGNHELVVRIGSKWLSCRMGSRDSFIPMQLLDYLLILGERFGTRMMYVFSH